MSRPLIGKRIQQKVAMEAKGEEGKRKEQSVACFHLAKISVLKRYRILLRIVTDKTLTADGADDRRWTGRHWEFCTA